MFVSPRPERIKSSAYSTTLPVLLKSEKVLKQMEQSGRVNNAESPSFILAHSELKQRRTNKLM